MEEGWIKAYRQLKKKGYYKKSAYVHLWLHLLLSVNRSPKEFMWNGNIIIVKAGQMITGRKELSQETGIPETTIERILDFFEKDAQIGQQKNTKYRLITILNWQDYQSVDNKRTTSGQQADTNKKLKNIEKGIEGTPAQEAKSFFEGDLEIVENTFTYFKEKTNLPDSTLRSEFQKFSLYWTEKNKSGTRQKWEQQSTFEVRRRLATWFNNIKSFKGSKNEPNYVL